MENKKELLEMALKLAKECVDHNPCEECPFELEGDTCLFNVFEKFTMEDAIDILEEKLNKFVISEGCCPDNVNHPKHYETGKFECIDVMVETQGVEAVKNFCICNAFKYVYRHKYKNGVEDVKKAIWYLNKFVELENEPKASALVPARGDRLKGD